jgi:hypothetical protein
MRTWRDANRCLDAPGALVSAILRSRVSTKSSTVPRRVKDYIDISEYTSLDDLIRYLETIRDNLPDGCDAELKIRGDEVFGKRLTITYFREQTPEEAELESKYAGGSEDDATIEQLKRKLDEVPYKLGKAKNG